MENWSCAFLGQNKFNYEPYQDRILEKIDYLIESGVTHFYNCYRNSFDALCAATVDKLRENNPQVKNILVLAHKPEGDFVLPDCFDEAVYLQNNDAPAKFAVRNTQRMLVQSTDYVISGVARGFSSARSIYNFAKKALKSTYDVLTDKSYNWKYFTPKQIEKAIAEQEERMKNDEVFRMLHEEIIRRYTEQSARREKRAKKRKCRKDNEYNPPVWVTVETKKTTED